MNRCDWIDCYKVGLWDGVEIILLNAEGQQKIRLTEAPTRFTYLCPEHFWLGVGSLNQVKVDPASKNNS